MMAVAITGRGQVPAPLPRAASQYIAWRGGEKFEQLQSTKEEGEVEDGGLVGRFERRLSKQGASWLHESFGDIQSTEAADESRVWKTNLSGQVVPLSAWEGLSLRRRAALMFAGVFHRDLGAEVSALNDQTLDGASWSGFRISFAEGDTYDFLTNPSSGELRAIRFMEDGQIRELLFDKWRQVDGVQQPLSVVIKSANAASDAAFRVETTNQDEEFPVGLFTPPKSATQMSFAGGADWSGWLHFELVGGRRIYFTALINSHPVRVLLDSGAEASVIDHTLAQRLNVRSSGRIGVEGAGGSAEAAFTRGLTIQLGRLNMSGVTAIAMDLHRIGRDVGTPLEAILGLEPFNELIVDLDFAHHRLAFRRPVGFQPPRAARRVSATPAQGNRAVPIQVEGRPEILAIMDLGNGSPLDLFPNYWKKENLLQGRPHAEAQMAGSGGKQPATQVTLRNVVFARESFTDVPVNLTAAAATTENSTRVQGNIGLPILRRFRVITDFPDASVFVVPTQHDLHLPFAKNRTGLTLSLDGDTLRIDHISPSSPAEIAGLRLGDRIAKVDAIAITRKRSLDDQTRWEYGSSGQRVSLMLSDGVRHSVLLRDYF
jgi:hypothetical protein